MREYRRLFEHHLLIRVASEGDAEMRSLLANWKDVEGSDYFECSEREARKAFLHRFVIAGAAVRYRAVHPREVECVISLDIALRRNDDDWFEALPERVGHKLIHRIYYGHFLCHVFHQDYIVARGEDCVSIEQEMLRVLDRRRARYPAEHNVGHIYTADVGLSDFYRSLDPGNRFNAGIGNSSKFKDYRVSASAPNE